MFLTLLLTMVGAPAHAGTDAVAAGEDLAAWRHMTELRLDDDKQARAYKRFIGDYPQSPLAELAWQRLLEAGAVDAQWQSQHQATVASLERSRAAHAHALSRPAADIAVAPLNADGTRDITLPSRWTGAVHAGAGFDGERVGGAFGLRLERGPVGLITRVGTEERAWASAGTRLSATPWGPFIESGIDTQGRVNTQAGGRYMLSPNWWLEGSVGGIVAHRKVSPAMRVELTRTMASPARVVTR